MFQGVWRGRRALRFALLLLPLLLCPGRAGASETAAERAANAFARQELARAIPEGNLPEYSLPPAELAKAQHLAAIGRRTHFAGEVWGILQLSLLLALGVVARLRDLAVRVSRRNVLQGYSFAFLVLAAIFVLDLPLDFYLQRLALGYQLSVQGWGSWFADQAKSFLLEWLIGGLLLLLLCWAIRTFPKRWWLAFWTCTLPLTVLGLFAMPYIEPLFFHYEPLSRTQPELVRRLEAVVAKAGMNIPPERMFLMQASSKLTTLNADVEGLGRSKRVVVWDTSVQKFTPDQILFVFAHESGHYVLGHIMRGLLLSFIGSFVLFFSGFVVMRFLLDRFGTRWRIPSQEDWGAAVVLVLVLVVFSAILEPLPAALSRAQEHAADVYGQEAIHGLVANPQLTAETAFDVLGATSLAEPNPPRWYEFWTYDHPASGRRAAFARAYDPWAPGSRPKYLPDGMQPPGPSRR